MLFPVVSPSRLFEKFSPTKAVGQTVWAQHDPKYLSVVTTNADQKSAAATAFIFSFGA
jgi:hypothetical protein